MPENIAPPFRVADPGGNAGPPPTRRAARTRLFRVLFLLLAIGLAVYRVLADYYELDPWFLQPSPNGLLALGYYELERYGDAARAWRAHYAWAHGADLPPPEADSAPEATPPSRRPGDPLAGAEASFVAQEYTQAAHAYRDALRRLPTDVDAKLGLAAALGILGEYAASGRLFEEILIQAVVGRRASTFLNFLTALEALERAPPPAMTAERLLTLAYAYRYLAIFDKRKLARVLTAANQALVLDPTLAGAFVSRGVVYAKQQDYPRAQEEFARAAALRPTADTYRRLAGVAGALGRPREELTAYKEAARLAPGSPHAVYQVGEILLRKYGDLPQASEYLRQAAELAPENRAMAVLYAFSLERLRRYEEALAVYHAVLRRWPRDPEALALKAGCLISLERYREAIALFLAAREVGPLSFEATQDLGYAYAQVKDPDQAIAAYEQALQLKPYSVETLYTLQGLYRRRGRHQEAYEAVRAILRLDPKHSGARRLLPYVERNRPR